MLTFFQRKKHVRLLVYVDEARLTLQQFLNHPVAEHRRHGHRKEDDGDRPRLHHEALEIHLGDGGELQDNDAEQFEVIFFTLSRKPPFPGF